MDAKILDHKHHKVEMKKQHYQTYKDEPDSIIDTEDGSNSHRGPTNNKKQNKDSMFAIDTSDKHKSVYD